MASVPLATGAEEATPLVAHGGVQRDVPGPRPPEFPDFDTGNTAVKLDGDAITIEAWVKVDGLRAGENAYIVGKGRTGTPEFTDDNQNWALRVREAKGQACVSFLFATRRTDTAKADAHWHRWTTSAGFAPGSGWPARITGLSDIVAAARCEEHSTKTQQGGSRRFWYRARSERLGMAGSEGVVAEESPNLGNVPAARPAITCVNGRAIGTRRLQLARRRLTQARPVRGWQRH